MRHLPLLVLATAGFVSGTARATDPNLTSLCSIERIPPAASSCEVGDFNIETTAGAYYGADNSFVPQGGQYLEYISGIQTIKFPDGTIQNQIGTQELGIVDSPVDVQISGSDPNRIGQFFLKNLTLTPEDPSVLAVIYGKVRSLIINSQSGDLKYYTPQHPAVTGNRGSYTAPGIILTEASPAYYGVFTSGLSPDVNGMLYQSFVVTSVGDGDWLEILFNGQSLYDTYGQSLVPNLLYTAVFDGSSIANEPGFLLFELHSVGDPNFSVALLNGAGTQIGAVSDVPEPDTWALMLIGLVAASLKFRRMRRHVPIHQSERVLSGPMASGTVIGLPSPFD